MEPVLGPASELKTAICHFAVALYQAHIFQSIFAYMSVKTDFACLLAGTAAFQGAGTEKQK